MGSKAILFLCLLAVVLMIASEVTARDLAENANAAEKSTRLAESKYGGGYGGGGGHYGGGGGHYGGGGGGGHYGGGGGGGHYGGGGGHCRYGCCGHGYGYGGGCKCCSYAGEAVDKIPETKPQN